MNTYVSIPINNKKSCKLLFKVYLTGSIHFTTGSYYSRENLFRAMYLTHTSIVMLLPTGGSLIFSYFYSLSLAWLMGPVPDFPVPDFPADNYHHHQQGGKLLHRGTCLGSNGTSDKSRRRYLDTHESDCIRLDQYQ
jgi:hypothetical protein